MSLRLWLRDRRLPAATVALALVAGIAQLLLWWLGPAPKTNSFVGPPRAGYILIDARMTEFNAIGQPSFYLQSPRLERREGDDSLYLNAPTFQLPAKQPNTPDWQGQSLYGWVNKAGTQIKLQGPVHMHRPPFGSTPATNLQSSDVTAWPKENRLETAAPTRIVQGASTISGVGMRANLTTKHLELLDDVHSTFMPAKPRG
ncbi:LPS export ABC transporter periplasmic protein LptC [Rhodanobacter sp. AS-Z3]|uniref:LPS export ABC transporter periplasmic protein LptC n=1 Tax=Rhodanobacter sp. AS-Z3 TaxID=3031330 RepID=UPI00247A053D|nr:LPS export ABC transporter periplasmic protein LptC [Rhodanobacter sp. AS-Z3]WEN14699.1 LPS export ABC transporter periplasmic protein LptC [Rhodanobacter sp. AS-Z3]